MKNKLLILLLCLMPLVAGAKTTLDRLAEKDSAIRELQQEIEAEKKALEEVQKETKSARDTVLHLKRKIDSQEALVSRLGASVRETERELTRLRSDNNNLKKTVDSLKKAIAQSNIYVLENLGYSRMKVVLFSKEYGKSVTTLELLEKANAGLMQKVEEFNTTIAKKSKVEKEIVEKLNYLDRLGDERRVVLAEFKREKRKYDQQLTILLQDEAGRKEYVEMLMEQARELERQVEKARVRAEKEAKDSKKPQQAIPVVGFDGTKGKLPWPIRGQVIEHYGYRMVEEAGVRIFNKGIKVRPEQATGVRPVIDGKVIYTNYVRGYGNIIIIRHDKDYYTIYAHMDEIFVKKDQIVDRHSIIGTIDVDPAANTAYLYFEIREHNEALDPMQWLSD